MKYLKRSLLFGFIVAFYSVDHSDARDINTAFMAVTGETRPPIGHVKFCRANPQQCRSQASQDRAMALTQDRWDELIQINHEVNRAVLPISDMDLYSVPEVWAFPDRYGDCEDYVLLKRHRLMQAGWPSGSLLITVVRDIDGGGHAVLTVRTDRGDFVLDNQEALIKHWTETPYSYLKRQSSKHAGKWVSVADRRDLDTLASTASTD